MQTNDFPSTRKNNTIRNSALHRAARRLALVAGLAFALAACSQSAPETQAAGPDAATENVAVETTIIDPTTTGVPTTNKGSDNTAQAPAPAPASAPVAPVACQDHEYPTSDFVTADSDLNVRRGPGTSNQAFNHLDGGDIVSVAWHADNFGCARIAGSGVWWAVWLEDGQVGWSHSSYLTPFVQLIDNGGEVVPEDDVHIDCVWLIDNSCVEVARAADGSVNAVFSELSEAQITWAQLSCVYLGDGDACTVLNAFGLSADTNYGLGNTLSMTPTEDLLNACSHFDGGTSNPGIAIQCEELETREGGI